MNKIGLAPLVSPLTCEEFMIDAWPKEPFVVHGLSETVKVLAELPFLQSLDALLNVWPSVVQAHLPDLSDESSAIDTTPKEARKLFSNKMALLFNNAQNISPVLQEWLSKLHEDLGLPRSGGLLRMSTLRIPRRDSRWDNQSTPNSLLMLRARCRTRCQTRIKKLF